MNSIIGLEETHVVPGEGGGAGGGGLVILVTRVSVSNAGIVRADGGQYNAGGAGAAGGAGLVVQVVTP